MIIENHQFRVTLDDSEWAKYLKKAGKAERSDGQGVEEHAGEMVLQQAERLIEAGAFQPLEMNRELLKTLARDIQFREYAREHGKFKGTVDKWRKTKPMSQAMRQDLERLQREFTPDESKVEAMVNHLIDAEQGKAQIEQVITHRMYVQKKTVGLGGEREGAGRKPKPVKMVTRSIAFTPDTLNIADKYAAVHGLSRSQVVDKAVRELVKGKITQTPR